MSEQQRPGAYFDIDGTIFKSSLLEKIIDTGIKIAVFKHDVFAKATDLRNQWQYDNNEDTYVRYIHALVAEYVQIMAGMDVEVFDKIVDSVVDEHRVRRFKFPRILMSELSNSHHPVAISGSPGRVVSKFISDMSFLEIEGSNYEIKEGRFTGKATATPDKAEVRKRIIEEKGLLTSGDVAVGDTMGDKSILEAVEFPIMFNPSATLVTHGKQFGWPIVLEQKDNITVLEAARKLKENGEYQYRMTNMQTLLGKVLKNTKDHQ